jgi:sigma-B regulation protein RsbQ
MWRFMLPELEKHFKVVLFDYVGTGQPDLNSFTQKRYAKLEGYAKDLEEILVALNLVNVSIISHSVTSIIVGIIGVSLNKDHENNFDALLKEADSALYEAKNKGRNMTILY